MSLIDELLFETFTIVLNEKNELMFKNVCFVQPSFSFSKMLRKGYSFTHSVRLKSGPQILEMLKLGKSFIFENMTLRSTTVDNFQKKAFFNSFVLKKNMSGT